MLESVAWLFGAVGVLPYKLIEIVGADGAAHADVAVGSTIAVVAVVGGTGLLTP